MKNCFLALTLSLSTSIFALDYKDAKQIAQIQEYESKIRKYHGELEVTKKQLSESGQNVEKLQNDFSKLLATYRKQGNEIQFLKYQNMQLIQELKKSGTFTQELANRFKNLSGRMPASVKEPEKSKK